MFFLGFLLISLSLKFCFFKHIIAAFVHISSNIFMLQYPTLWCQLEDTFQLIVTPQGMELVMVHIEVISQCLKKYRVEYKACYIFLLDTIQL